MPKIALVTDTTADIPPAVAAELGVRVVPGSVAFAEHAFIDGELSARDFFARMRGGAELPRPFAVREAAYKAAFDAALADGKSVVCMVMPFDVTPSFTTAAAAMLAIGEAGQVDIKITNPGVASAGLCSLIVSLSAGVQAGWDVPELLARMDEVEPRCDTLFVPEDPCWLGRAGRLRAIEERLGEVGGGIPIVRVGTRITGVALEASPAEALRRAAETAGARAGKGQPLVVTIDHAAAPERAEEAARLMRERWDVARLIVTELSPAIGTQLGPGAVGIGVAPLVVL
ncbi:MAG: DegV family protein [Tepidiformaceae bacterium]